MFNRGLYVRSGQAISSECTLNRVSRLFLAPTQTYLVNFSPAGGLWLLGWLLVRLLRLEVLWLLRQVVSRGVAWGVGFGMLLLNRSMVPRRRGSWGCLPLLLVEGL